MADEAMTPAEYRRATEGLDRPLTWWHSRHHTDHVGADDRSGHAVGGGQQDGRRVAPLPVTHPDRESVDD